MIVFGEGRDEISAMMELIIKKTGKINGATGSMAWMLTCYVIVSDDNNLMTIVVLGMAGH